MDSYEKRNKIKMFIWKNIDRENGQVIENENFDDIYELIEYVNNLFNCNIECKHCGGFDSPGYDVDCYAWAGIIDGELYFDTLEQESY